MPVRSMRSIVFKALLLGGALCAAGLFVTRPQRLAPNALAGTSPDEARGALVFCGHGMCKLPYCARDRCRKCAGWR